MAKTKKQQTSKWDIERDIRGKWFRVRVKALTNRDGLKQEQLRLSLAARLGAQDSTGLEDASTEMLRLVQYWPLLRYGTEEIEGLEIPETEDQFWAIPEIFLYEWYEKIVEVNPQYGIPFLELKGMLEKALTRISLTASGDTSKPEENGKTGSEKSS